MNLLGLALVVAVIAIIIKMVRGAGPRSRDDNGGAYVPLADGGDGGYDHGDSGGSDGGDAGHDGGDAAGGGDSGAGDGGGGDGGGDGGGGD